MKNVGRSCEPRDRSPGRRPGVEPERGAVDGFDTDENQRTTVYGPGHVGAALLCYAPIAAALTRSGEPALALLGTAVGVALSTLPDADQFDVLPVDHRGPTHTVWFVVAVTAVVAAVGWLLGFAAGRPAALAATAGSAAFVSLTSHLLADVVTPMGIRPFAPLSEWHHSFDLTPAKNPRANATLLGLGALFAVGCQVAVWP